MCIVIGVSGRGGPIAVQDDGIVVFSRAYEGYAQSPQHVAIEG
jgi:hypothetical protein